MLNDTNALLRDEQGSGEIAESTETKVDPRDSLIVLCDDQDDEWFDHRRNPELSGGQPYFTTLDLATEHVLQKHAEDGERSDRKVNDLNKWLFNASLTFAAIGRPEADALFLRHTAFAHLCERAKAPPKYLRSIPARYVVPSLNWGIANRSEGPALIRLAGDDEIRAILSHRYAAFDDCVVLPQLRTSLEAAGLLNSVVARVVATGLTTLMRIGIEGDAIAIEGTDEIAEVAIDLTNGEVGNRAVALSPAVYLRTKGLATRRTGLRLRHLGTSDKLSEAFRESIPEVLAEARKLRTQITVAVDKAIGSIVVEAEKLRLLGLSISEARDVMRMVARSSNVTLPRDTAEWEDLLGDVKTTAFNVFVAIAQLGEDRPTDRRLELEEAAARYLARATK